MADNYLEKKMQDREYGIHRKIIHSSRPRPGFVSFPFPALTVFAITDNPENKIFLQVVSALTAAGCKVALAITASACGSGRNAAQLSGARFFPFSADKALAEAIATWGNPDVLFHFCADPQTAFLDLFGQSCARESRIIALGGEPLPKPARAATSNAIGSANPVTSALYLLLPQSSMISGQILQ